MNANVMNTFMLLTNVIKKRKKKKPYIFYLNVY